MDSIVGVVIVGASLGLVLSLMHLLVAAQVGNDREMSAAAFNITSKCCVELVTVGTYKVIVVTYASRQCDCTCVSEGSWVW